jgi:hypothetical protein
MSEGIRVEVVEAAMMRSLSFLFGSDTDVGAAGAGEL